MNTFKEKMFLAPSRFRAFVLSYLMLLSMTSAYAQSEQTTWKPTLESKSIHVNDMRPDLGLSDAGILPMNSRGSLIESDEWVAVGTSNSYDRQTQNAVYPMTKRHDDGFIGATWTNDDNLVPFPESFWPYRGIGYTYSTDGGVTWSEQENRVGGIPLIWPSYAQWGPNGEAILGRSFDSYEHQGIQILNGLVLLTRSNKGQGEWKITPVPYPAGTSPDDGYTMAWARMTTSGTNHQYIHIMSPMQYYEDGVYYYPTFYYRTQDGITWDIAGKLVPEMVGQEWDAHSSYTDAITFADATGDMVACSFINWGYHSYVLRSHNNGTTWESIKFFDTPVGYYNTPSHSAADTCYIPKQGCIALDNNGKIHVAFSVLLASNYEEDGYVTYYAGLTTSFLSYWNEDMPPINGAAEYVKNKMEPKLNNYFDWNQSNPEAGEYYVKSTVPELPIIGYCTPIFDEHIFRVDDNIIKSWATQSYGKAGCFSFPQMAVDDNNKLHLAYLGLVDGLQDDSRWKRHPYYTTRNTNGTWTKTEYLVNSIDLIDQEFAYLTSAGFDNGKMILMAQVDFRAGVYQAYAGDSPDHNPTMNHFCFMMNAVDISGKVMRQDLTPLEEGIVLLYRKQVDGKYMLKQSRSIKSDGSYLFSFVPGGDYVIKAIADDSEDLIPTYYNNTEMWNEATVISVKNGLPIENIDITMIQKIELPEGDLEIVGEIEEVDEGKKSRSPMQNIDIYLLYFQDNAWKTVITTRSDAAGHFQFNNLPDGIYKALVDIPGLPMLNPISFIFGEKKSVNILFEVTEDGIRTTLDGVGIDEGRMEKGELRIYPNPTDGQLYVSISDHQISDIRLFDMMGRQISIVGQSEIGQSEIVINIAHLPNGVYFIRSQTETGVITRKVVKQ